jgi:hypothetical protein
MGGPTDVWSCRPRDPDPVPASQDTGRRARLRHRGRRHSLVVLSLVAGAIMLATGRPAGIGLALLLSAMALLATPDPGRDMRRGR